MSEETSKQASAGAERRPSSPSSSSEVYQLLYSKSRVTLHPTPYAKDNVPGYLAILKRRPQSRSSAADAASPPPGIDNRSSIILSWLPEDLVKDRSETAKFVDVELREAEGPGERGEEDLESLVRDDHSGKVLRMRELIEDESILVQPPPLASSGEPGTPRSPTSYAFSHPLGSIYAVHMAPPTISNWYGSMTLSLVRGDTLPPLYFHDDESRSTILGVIRASKGVPNAPSSTSASASPSPSPSSSLKQPASSSSSAQIPPATMPGTTYPPTAPTSNPSAIGNGGGTPPIWGGDELIQHLRKYAFIHRSVHDFRVFLVNPSPPDLEFHSTPVFADDAVDGINNRPDRGGAGLGSGDSSFAGLASRANSDFAFPDDPFAPTYPSAAMRQNQRYQHKPGEPPGMDALTTWAKTTKLSLLSSFSHVTRSARDASRQILSHPAGRPYTSRLPAAVQSFAHAGPLGPFGPSSVPASPEDVKKLSQKAGVMEYDSARVYLAKWARLVAEEGERNKRREEEEAARRSCAKPGSSSMTPSSSASGSAVKTEVGGLGVFEVLDLDAAPESNAASSRRRRRYDGITLEEWRSWFDDQANGRPRISFAEMKTRIFERGLAPETRRSAWPFLLGVVPWDSTAEARAQDWAAKRSNYYRLKSLWAGPSAVPFRDGSEQEQPTSDADAEAAALRERDDVVEQRHRIRVDCLRTDRKHPMFRQPPGEDASVPNDETGESSPDKSVLLSGRIQDRQAGQRTSTNNHVTTLGEILLTYTFYDTLSGSGDPSGASTASPTEKGEVQRIDASELGGYVQGMSDLCAPLYITCDADEVEAFWCFCGFMKRMRPNFLSSQQGMKTQLLQLQALIRRADPELYAHLELTDSLHLFFCFRWLLVRFKREFSLEEVCRIWEACWAIEPIAEEGRGNAQDTQKATGSSTLPAERGGTAYFHLFVCLSILVSHRGPTLAYLHCFDEVLQYFQGLAAGGQMDVERVIQGAEALFLEMRRRAADADPDTTNSDAKHHDGIPKAKDADDGGSLEADGMMRELLGLDLAQK